MLNDLPVIRKSEDVDAGSIVIDCAIRNLSEDGRPAPGTDSVAIPDRFEFSETMSGKRRPVTVAWRKGDMIGIRFA
jgi:hypothetical protein